jgi:hypothetical protein
MSVSSRKSEDLQHKEAQVLLAHIQRWNLAPVMGSNNGRPAPVMVPTGCRSGSRIANRLAMKCGEDPSLAATSRTCRAQDSGEDVKLYQDLFQKSVKLILGCDTVSSRKSEDCSIRRHKSCSHTSNAGRQYLAPVMGSFF